MKTTLISLLLLLSFSSIFAQLENIPLITVTGQSAIKVKPDYVILGLQISKQIKTNSQGTPSILEIFKNEDTKIRLFDFDEKEISETLIQTKGANYIKEVFITINDLDKLDKYLLELHKLGFANYIHFDYRLRNYQQYKDQARTKAVAQAKTKAKELAQALSQTIGKAHTIEELDSKSYNWYTTDNKQNLEDISFDLGSDQYLIEPGFIVITSKIRVSFDLQK